MPFRSWTPEKVAAHNERVRQTPKQAHNQVIASYQAPVKAERSKYGNQKVVIDGISFMSKKEGERYRQLKMMESAGKIANLRLQPVYELAPAVTINGKKKRALEYRADFTYTEKDNTVVEDVKGMLTDVYKIKRHLLKHIFGIDIVEI